MVGAGGSGRGRVLADVGAGSGRTQTRFRNDASLRAVAIASLAEIGWDGFNARDVARRAGLSYGAVYTRFEHLDELVSTTWSDVLLPRLADHLHGLVDAVLDVPDEDRFVEAMGAFAHPSPELLAAMELILASMVDPRAALFVREDVEALMAELIGPAARRSPVEATVAATCAFVATGLLLLSRRSWAKGVDLESELRRYHRALHSPAEPIETPRDRVAEFLYLYVFDTEDERLERVLQATAMSMGELGYHRTTISRICRIAGVSSGFVMGRFPSKAELFRRITDEMWGRGLAAISEFVAENAEEIGPTLAEALAWREYQNPAIAKMVVLVNETGRRAGFDPEFGAFVEAHEMEVFSSLSGGGVTAFLHSEYALGNGLPLVAHFFPEVRDLPYACVTENLVATAPH
ncbi:MAG: TetR/AcrR family transcriptional regulator [Actinomycetes bacterium]